MLEAGGIIPTKEILALVDPSLGSNRCPIHCEGSSFGGSVKTVGTKCTYLVERLALVSCSAPFLRRKFDQLTFAEEGTDSAETDRA